jgi:two-component system phosphate regulon sensor histidine kinase PhoR
VRFRTKLIVASFACVELSALAAVAALLALEPRLVDPRTIKILLAVATVSGALLAWAVSIPLARRIGAIEERARRYAAGNLAPTLPDYAQDELGDAARMLDTVTRDLAGRLGSLEADRARLAAILSGMIEGVLVVNEHGRLQLANDAARRMLGIDPAAEGRLYPEIVRQPAVAQQIAQALKGTPTEGVELPGPRDPKVTLIARTAAVNAPNGRGAVVVLHDITDLRRADQIRRDFVANVSHELRTPLTAIRGYVEALLDEGAAGAGDAEGTQKFLEIIARHTTRMERLVKDLLRLARLDARQEALEMERCDVGQIFSGVIADLSPTIESKGQRVVIDVPQDAAQVDGDPAKLHDIVRNLVENAVNYSPEGADVRLSASRVNGKYTITVADSGPGIPPEDLGRVFERFYRVDKSRARPGGTGLGLAIVKHLVELHGGEARAENAPTGGAVFTVTLPSQIGV